MDTIAVVFEEPEVLTVRRLPLVAPGVADVVVDVAWSGISTGTERLLFTGRMPPFPGLGYPLVPGYEAVGRVVEAGAESGRREGDLVFIAGARCFGETRGLFGGSAARLVVPGARTVRLADAVGERGVLLALAATAYHALGDLTVAPDLIVGHGALGRLLARLTTALWPDTPPTVWETNPTRRDGADGYRVSDPADDDRQHYRAVYDVSGHASLDHLVGRLAPRGEIVLAGFYSEPVSFAFPPAFLREARFRVAAQWGEGDLEAVSALVHAGTLSLDGLITHRAAVADAAPVAASRVASAYATAFGDPACVKMVLDWRQCA
jgi:3-hydroxyethyl bacteriochlorophyllide a dehydrogenase